MRYIVAALVVFASATPALADSRSFTVTSFDRLRIASGIDVVLRVGPGPSARAEGGRSAVDAVRLDQVGTTLVVRDERLNWTGSTSGTSERPTLYLTTPAIGSVTVDGAGDLRIDKARGQRLQLALGGAGTVAVDAIDADALSLSVSGSGTIRIAAGRAGDARVALDGSGRIDAAGLVASDVTVVQSGPGAVVVGARRTAKIDQRGSGSVTIEGTPACTVKRQGSGSVVCGEGDSPSP